MGIELGLWRARIGLFVQPRRTTCRSSTLRLSTRLLSLSVRLFLFLSLLTCGDIESNPGPPRQQNPTRQTRQTSLSFSQHQPDRSFSNSNNESRTPRINEKHENQSHEDMFDFLRNMKTELAGQNEQVRKDLSGMNMKMDSITSAISDLKNENILLKKSNEELRLEIKSLNTKVDTLEAHSRRNNLRFIGIDGQKDEEWSESEEKVRDFIANELNMPEKREVEIERAHRLKKSGKRENADIIVKFTKYKDCSSLLQKARETLGKGSKYSVQQDYTDKVKRHRRELGKEIDLS